MTQAPIKPLTLDEFLELPETKPASEFIANLGLKPRLSKTAL
jgi:hypothetical protein